MGRAFITTRDFTPTKTEDPPDVVVDGLPVPNGRIWVVRDDRLLGGTKERAITSFLYKSNDEGFREFVYASPFSGFAQVALATACHSLGFSCALFCEADKSQGSETINPHEFTQLAKSFGARIVLSPDLESAERLALEYASLQSYRLKLPLGFNCARYIAILEQKLSRQWKNLCCGLSQQPNSLWLPVGSGTLATAFRSFLPSNISINLVDVHVLPKSDSRIKTVSSLENVKYYCAPEVFAEPAYVPPPIPSNRFYDAKLWRFILEKANDGDVWWNVAR